MFWSILCRRCRAGRVLLLLSVCGWLAAPVTGSVPGSPKNDKSIVWIDGPAGKLCAVSMGENGGTPLLFVHSLAGDWQQWLDQLYFFCEDRKTFAFDLRGHGESEKPAAADYTIEAMSADLAAVVEYFELPQFVLIGHSLGAGVAIQYAAAHPGKVAGLVLTDPIGDSRQVPETEMQPFLTALQSEAYRSTIREYWQQLLVNSSEEVKTRVMASLQIVPPQVVIGAFRSMRKFDILAALQKIKAPVLSITSELNDTPFSLQNLLPHLPHKRMSGTGHWLQMDRPAEFNQILESFLVENGL